MGLERHWFVGARDLVRSGVNLQALCRRAYEDKDSRLAVDDLEIDTTARKVTRAGRPVTLKPREFALLEYLARRRGHVVTRAEIEEHIYAGEVEPMSNVVDSAICSLRQKLGEANSAPLIHTRRGQGYELTAE